MRYLLALLLVVACAPEPISTADAGPEGEGTCPELAQWCQHGDDIATAWPEADPGSRGLRSVHADLAQSTERQPALRCLWYPPPCWRCPRLGSRVWHRADIVRAVDHWVADGCDGPGEGRVQAQYR